MTEPASEGERAQSVPAIYINRFFVTVNPTTTRIAFGEALVGVDATMRMAAVMTTADAEALANLLLDLIEQNRGLQTVQ